jgi:hypothetical protein
VEGLSLVVQTHHHAQVALDSKSKAFLQRFADEFISDAVGGWHALDLVQTEQAGDLSGDDEAVDHFYEFRLAEVVVLEEEHSSLVLVGYSFQNHLHFLLELSAGELPQRGQSQQIQLQQ